jgi:hypothetical protein
MPHSAFFGELVTHGGPIFVRFNRRRALASASLFGAVIAIGVSRAPDTSSAVTIVAVCGVCMIAYLIRALRRGPLFIFDDEHFTDCKSGEITPWTNVFEIYLRQRQGLFGVYHHLVFTIRLASPSASTLETLSTSRVPVKTLRRSIDQLSMPWSDIVTFVQQRSGIDIPTRREAGPFRKSIS